MGIKKILKGIKGRLVNSEYGKNALKATGSTATRADTKKSIKKVATKVKNRLK